MNKSVEFRYAPDYAVSPGEVLEDTLQSRCIKKAELALRAGLSPKTISLIISGNAPVSSDTAVRLERVLGVSATIWSNLEANYRLFEARRSRKPGLAAHEAWANKFPLKELARRGLIVMTTDPAEKVDRLLHFLGVENVDIFEKSCEQLKVCFRSSPSFRSSPEAVTAWLRIGQLCAEKAVCEPYERSRFKGALQEIRKLTCEKPEVFQPRMKQLCADSGVVLALADELPGTHLSGAAQWLSKEKALIMLSLRHKTDDHFWFSFFHEAGHVLLGSKKSSFLDEANDDLLEEDEQRADRFASDSLIPRNKMDVFIAREDLDLTDIQEFAEELGIAPGIVVGRLQHDRYIRWNVHNGLKRHFMLVEACN